MDAVKNEFPSIDREVVVFNTKKDPHAWIQWKGTDVCADIHCKCGEHSHFDGYFAYHIKCPKCGQVYEMNGHIELIPLDFEPDMTKMAFDE